MSKTLVIYFSHKGENYFSGSIVSVQKGNTEFVAEYIRDAVDGGIFEIVTSKPYSDDYRQCCREAKAELDAGARPGLVRYLDSIDDYGNIVVCGPCWCGTYPMAVFTQIDRLDLSGKKVFAVVTHEGSGMGCCERDLRKACKGAVFGKGLAIFGGQAEGSREAVRSWVDENLF